MTSMRFVFISFFASCLALSGCGDSPTVPASPPGAAPSPQPATETIESLRPKFIGYWKPAIDEECVRANLEGEAENARFLQLNGQLIKDPTPAQREEYRKLIPQMTPERLKALKNGADTIIRLDADGSALRVLKEVPYPGIPQIERARWSIEKADHVAILRLGEGGDNAKATIFTIFTADAEHIVLTRGPEQRGPMLAKMSRVTKPPKWALDLLNSDAGAKPPEPKK